MAKSFRSLNVAHGPKFEKCGLCFHYVEVRSIEIKVKHNSAVCQAASMLLEIQYQWSMSLSVCNVILNSPSTFVHFLRSCPWTILTWLPCVPQGKRTSYLFDNSLCFLTGVFAGKKVESIFSTPFTLSKSRLVTKNRFFKNVIENVEISKNRRYFFVGNIMNNQMPW